MARITIVSHFIRYGWGVAHSGRDGNVSSRSRFEGVVIV